LDNKTQKTLALFDFDGTITTKDSLIDFIKYAVGNISYYVGFIKLMPILTAYGFKMIPNNIPKATAREYAKQGYDCKDNPFYTTRFDYETPKYIGPNTLRDFTIARFTDLSDSDKNIIKNRIDMCNNDKKW